MKIIPKMSLGFRELRSWVFVLCSNPNSFLPQPSIQPIIAFFVLNICIVYWISEHQKKEPNNQFAIQVSTVWPKLNPSTHWLFRQTMEQSTPIKQWFWNTKTTSLCEWFIQYRTSWRKTVEGTRQRLVEKGRSWEAPSRSHLIDPMAQFWGSAVALYLP